MLLQTEKSSLECDESRTCFAEYAVDGPNLDEPLLAAELDWFIALLQEWEMA